MDLDEAVTEDELGNERKSAGRIQSISMVDKQWVTINLLFYFIFIFFYNDSGSSVSFVSVSC